VILIAEDTFFKQCKNVAYDGMHFRDCFFDKVD